MSDKVKTQKRDFMKIRVQFYYTEYKNSKIATFLSKLKSGVYGFIAWLGLFLVPFGFAGHIGSMYGCAQEALTAVGIIAIILYLLLFLIDESKIAERKSIKMDQKSRKSNINQDDFKYTYSKIIPDSMIELPIEEYRIKYISNALEICEKTMLLLNLHSEFLFTKKEIIDTISNELMIFEAIYGKQLYLSNSTNYKNLLDNLPNRAIGISLYYGLLKNDFLGLRPGIIMEHAPKILLSELNSPHTQILNMSKENMRRFLVKEIKKKL